MFHFRPEFTKEFLGKQLHRDVVSLSMKPGSILADSFMGVVYPLEVKVKPECGLNEEVINEKETESLHLVVKCYPHNPAAHEYLNLANVYNKEVMIYQVLLYKFQTFLDKIGTPLHLPTAPFLAGRAVDFSRFKGNIKEDKFGYGPLDNFLVLADVRKMGYSRIEQHKCLDLNHCILVVNKLAMIHAISWAYQLKREKEKKTLLDQFSFLKQKNWPSQKGDGVNCCNFNFEAALETLKNFLGKESPIVKGTKRFQTFAGEILNWFQTDGSEANGIKEKDLDRFMRIVPPESKENYVSWNVFSHGDCAINNMLFKYNGTTGQPDNLILVDFQYSKEGCPTVDLAFMIYLSTDGKFRKKHLNDILKIYHDCFVYYCNVLNVQLLPGFSLDSLKSRFHRSKLYAFIMCIIVFPIILKDHNSDLEDIKSQEKIVSEAFAGIWKWESHNSLLHSRIVELAFEFYIEGII